VCFGADLPAATLIDGEFGERAAAFYGAVLEAEIPRPKGRARQ
jgi:hypothetical protein